MSNDEMEAASPARESPAPTAPQAEKRRPKLDLTSAGGPRKRPGKSMFGLVLGTLNKAKIEDKERNASEAAKKRQLIEQRLQNKLRKETEGVRKAEEAKKEKLSANRKEEDLQLQDSIYKLRRTRLPILANFLLTSDIIPDELSDSSPPSYSPEPPRGHPPPLYYLPAILLPNQQAFLDARKAHVNEATEKEWESFKEQRTAGIAEINELRHKVAQNEKEKQKAKNGDGEATMEVDDAPPPTPSAPMETAEPTVEEEKVEEKPKSPVAAEEDTKMETADDEDAVEY